MTEAVAGMLVSTGIAGLDDILGGGLPAGRLYLLQGNPGAGKTTLALQFLMEGAARGERVLYITLSETRDEMIAVAESHGWDLGAVELFELSQIEELTRAETQQTMFHPGQVELTETMRLLLDTADRVDPQRLVFDSVSELRLLASDPLRYRRQILALKQHFAGRHTTVLLLDDNTAMGTDLHLQSLAHGVIDLEQHAQDYGIDRRRLRVRKLRGVQFRAGYHDYEILRGGMVVFPRLIAAEHRTGAILTNASRGVDKLDALLGGGLDRGTATLLIGPSGVGKSTVAIQIAVAAAERGERAALYIFDERRETLFHRAAGLGMPLARHVEAGLIHVRQIDPAEMTPGAFASTVTGGVTANRHKVVVVDSLNGYLHAMSAERDLLLQMHELLSFLGQQDVMTLLVYAQHGMLAASSRQGLDISYLADTVLLFRHYEFAGRIQQAMSVFKKRSGDHEKTIRDFHMTPRGLTLGEPLEEFHGVLTGVPIYQGNPMVAAP
jgi:circadian clock protein KaiC